MSDEQSTKALKEICKHSKVPIIADIHFVQRAKGCDSAKCLKLIWKYWMRPLKEIIKSAKYNDCSIRIGVSGLFRTRHT